MSRRDGVPNADLKINYYPVIPLGRIWHDKAGSMAPEVSKATSASLYLGEQSRGATGGSEKFQLTRAPKYVNRYASMSQILYEAAVNYAREVSGSSYPAKEHCYE